MRQLKWNPLDRVAQYLVDRFKPDEAHAERHAFNQQLLMLHGGRREAIREYYVRKYRQVLVTICGMIVVVAAALAAVCLQERSVTDRRLERPGYAEDPREQELYVHAEGEGEGQAVTVTVSGRKYSKTKVQQLLDQAEEEFDALLPGENESVDKVQTNLVLKPLLAEETVAVSYVMIPYGVIDEDGSILEIPDPEGTLVEIQAKLTCQEETRELLRTVRVLPPERTAGEVFWDSVEASVREADETEIEEAYLTLPGEMDGRTLSWQYPKAPWLRLALAGLLLMPLLVWYQADSKVREQAQERNRQLLMDYGDLMWKMTMLSGAGLTIRAVFFRIANSYLEEKHKEPRCVYEEIVLTCREMKSGVSEAAAYENFGRRCGQQAYIRLGSLLAQNLKKGSKGLTEILEKEAETAMEERRSAARETGEKAGTKLLMPMILLLSIVLIALTLPCVMAF